MAHECPSCGCCCHCSGDVDDLELGVYMGCKHCGIEEDDTD